MVYILANAKAVSGGPELLHQCCHELNAQGIQAYMVYIDRLKFAAEASEAVKKTYGHYDCPIAKKVVKTKDNIIIIPESLQFILPKFKTMRRIIWWLSVDNFYNARKTKYAKFYAPFGMSAEKYNPFNPDIFHCYQSEYARDFLQKNGIQGNQMLPLSDFLSDEFIEQTVDEAKCYKKNVVLYNPKKGIEYTKKLIAYSSEIEWIPLSGYSHEEMIRLMMQSKVYIDFGNHPGKDRIPREAVMCGCCVITGKDGAAGNMIDIPITDEYKFDADDSNIPHIIKKINLCFSSYDILRKDFDPYRNRTKKEKQIFKEEIRQLIQTYVNVI